MTLELRRLGERTYYVPSAVNVGVYVVDGRAVLIDAGGDDDAGRRLLKLLTDRGWRLELIVCTHSNADHIGGNAFLQRRTGCRIAATAAETAFVERPILEPSLLYGGYPMRGLRNKFLMAKPSTVSDVIAADGPILETGLEAVALPGHYVDMIGVRTPDDVLFLADSLFSAAIVEKYPLFFIYDFERHLETLARLRSTRAAWYVPSHAPAAEEIGELVAVNEASVLRTLGAVEECCAEPARFDAVLERVCLGCGIELDANQYVLVGSTVRSALAYLADQGRVELRFEGAVVRWARLDRDDRR